MNNTDETQCAENEIIDCINRIGFYTKECSIKYLFDCMQNNNISMKQTRKREWSLHKKSRFIESIIMGIPLPFLFFKDRKDEALGIEVVDGEQRLITIKEFLQGSLTLSELFILNSSSGFSFKDMTKYRQQRIKNRAIRCVILNSNISEEDTKEVYRRVNI